MPYRYIDTSSKYKGHELLRSHWRPDAVARNVRCHTATAYRWEQRQQRYGTINAPHQGRNGRPPKIHHAAQQGLTEYLRRYPWLYQDEQAAYLAEEWDIHVDKATICRLLKRLGISRKKGQRLGPQSEILRRQWQAEMGRMTAEQLVFIDESIFKLQSGWRCFAYAPIGEPARWHDDMDRGKTWSILPAYTVDGYLPCTGIKEGFYNGDAFYEWICNDLLPHCNAFPEHRSVICLDNLGVHLRARIREAIEAKVCLIRYLPTYSPDFNPIELSFGLLKTWLRRHLREIRPYFELDFGGLLIHAIEQSGCDKKAKEHFRHSAGGGYMFEGDLEAFMMDLYQESV